MLCTALERTDFAVYLFTCILVDCSKRLCLATRSRWQVHSTRSVLVDYRPGISSNGLLNGNRKVLAVDLPPFDTCTLLTFV